MNTDYLIAVFRSRQQATAFWSNLRRAGVEAMMISSPAALSRGCGVSVRFRACDWQTVKKQGAWQKMTAFDGFFFFDKTRKRFVPL